jgi:alkylation response protein AidB-like acyl-CoA dehydrogenase
MDLDLSEEQQMLRTFARDFLERECPEAYVREMEEDEKGYSPQFWSRIASQGWPGLLVPEQLGGAGMSFQDLVVLAEEFGRFLVPGPFLSDCVAAIALLEGASAEQQALHLRALASGDQIWTLAMTEQSASFDAAGIELSARKDGGDYVLNGTKLFVRDSHVADWMVVVARTGATGEEGISLFAVDARAPGIGHELIPSMSSDRYTEVQFKDVRVAAAQLLGPEGKAWPIVQRVQQKAAVLECAYLVGLAQMAFDITIDYQKERVQFGKPIAAFQANQHKAADMRTDVDGCRYLTYSAAWAITEGAPDAAEQVHIAKAWCSDASERVVWHAQQMHGGIGFTKDYRIQLYFRRQKAAELAWGDGDYHREKLCQLLGI